MDTSKLKRFAQQARRLLRDQVKAKMTLVLAADSAARRESLEAVKELEEQIRQTSQEQVLDKVAYTWFNRFCALRFMDLNGYNKVRVVSPADESQFQPEILADAKQGHINETRVPDKTRQRVDVLLSGQATSNDPQQEAYRLLVVAECNAFHQAMPYLFERIADYTELLMPDDLLSGNSVLAYTREAMTPDACQDVEVIGWLYQFYISEKKDQVFEGLKKNQKITPENIPAATQLFTPHWIVRYLVENSLGRLWMLNHPNSPLAGQMDYYIAPEQPETDFLKIDKPEDIKICDPACGSGHMLTYAFDLLYAIYEEVGTEKTEIAEKILTHNLFGIEIDERAGELAAFALTMKARSKTNSRFFNKGIKPHICVLQKVSFDSNELNDYMAEVGRDLFTLDLRETLNQFAEVDNLGSLIKPKLTSVGNVLPLLQAKDMTGSLFLANTHAKVLQVLHMAEYLSPRYAVVVANPPYMGGKGMNKVILEWVKNEYPDSKSDLYSVFIERGLELCISLGVAGLITMQSWMFLGAFEPLRRKILQSKKILSMAHIGSNGFDSIGGEVVSTTAFAIKNGSKGDLLGNYQDLTQGASESEKIDLFFTAGNVRFKFDSNDFLKIPGALISFRVARDVIDLFSKFPKISKELLTREGLATGNNSKFLRLWHEVSYEKIAFKNKLEDKSSKKWVPYLKGGSFRKWSGNTEFLINWKDDGDEIKNFKDLATGRIRSHNYNGDWAFKKGLTWSSVSSRDFCVRYVDGGFMFDATGTMGFAIENSKLLNIIAFMNSKVSSYLMKILSPTIRFQSSHPLNLPYKDFFTCSDISKRCIDISQDDWDRHETSYGFLGPSWIDGPLESKSVVNLFEKIKLNEFKKTEELKSLEERINEVYIKEYALGEYLNPKVLSEDVTLIGNPHYKYGASINKQDLEQLINFDLASDLISYSVGCMFGRYALDKKGLILAGQGGTFEDYRKQIPNSRFEADADNVIPMLDSDWFADDVTDRFRQFLRVTFGDEHYDENLAFIEQALNVKGKRNYTLRDYMLGEFYTDHVKRYKKRPIYWLFSSPKGTFNALIYLHRYRPDTASVVLRYLREFRAKLAARQSTLDQVLINPTTSQGEKTRANKEIETLKKQIIELQDYENDTLYPLATANVALDLDDGVKVNYLKLGAALKKITGLDAKEED
jgi:hypothetical protein